MIELTPIPLDPIRSEVLVEVANDLSREIDTVALGQGDTSPEYQEGIQKAFEKIVAQLELMIGKDDTKEQVRVPNYL